MNQNDISKDRILARYSKFAYAGYSSNYRPATLHFC